MKPKHLLLMAIVGLAASSCQSPNSGSVVGSVSDESSVSSPVSTPISDSIGSDVTSSGPSSESTSEPISVPISEPTSNPTSVGPTSTSVSDSTSTSTSTPTSSGSTSESTSIAPVPQRTVQQAIGIGRENASLVKNGTIGITDYAGTSIQYEFGVDSYGEFLHYHVDSIWNNEDYYICNDKSGWQVNIQVDAEGAVTKPSTGYYSTLGYAFNNIISYSVYQMGVEELVAGNYSIGSANTNKDFVESSSGGIYSYGFGRGDSYSFRFITTEFTLSSGSEIFDSVTITVDEYYSSSFIMDDSTGVIELLPGAEPSSTTVTTIAQVAGERTATNPYDVEEFFYTSFDLALDGAPISDPIEVEASGWDGRVELDIANPAPATANSSFDEIRTEVISGEPDDISVTYNSYSRKILIQGAVIGNFTVKISSRDVEKTINIAMVPARAKSISVVVMKEGINDPDGDIQYNSDTYTGGSPVSLYAGNELILSSSILPNVVVDAIEYQVISGEADNITLSDGTIAQWDGDKPVKKVSSSVIGSYTIRVSAQSTPAVYTDVEINVIEKPKMAEFLNGIFAYKSKNAIRDSVTFTPDAVVDPATDSMTGSAVVTMSGNTEQVTYVVSEAAQPGAFDVTFTHVSGDELNASVKIGPDYSIALYTESNTWGTTLTRGTPEFIYSGQYKSGDDYGFTLSTNGGFQLSFYGTPYQSIEGNYVLSERPEGGYYINFIATAYTEADQTLLDFDDDTSYIDEDGNIHINMYSGEDSQTIIFTLIPAEEL